MDNYRTLRELPLVAVLAHLGFADFRKTRDGHAGPCPIHGSKTNKGCFRFTDAGVYHCLSCHAKGKGALDLVLALRKISLSEAVKVLEGIQGLPATESPRGEPLAAARSFLEPLKSGSYSKFFKAPCPWLEARGISQETADAYGCGWYSNPTRKSAYSERFMIPFRRFEDGAVMGYMGRDISEKPAVKYLVPTGFPKNDYVFGAWEIKNRQNLPVKFIFLVESALCVLRFRQLGFDAVSTFGWSVSTEQLTTLRQLAKGVVYLPDTNKRRECQTAVHTLSQDLWVRMPALPGSVADPEHLDQNQIRQLLL